MSKGTDAGYWEEQNLPSIYKHALLKRYIPVFTGKTGTAAGSVVYMDGFAGEGRYENGEPGSAALILDTARHHVEMNQIRYQVFLCETKASSRAKLEEAASEYRRDGLVVEVRGSDAASTLTEVVAAADGDPLFLFLDPCGLGVPYSRLCGAITGPRASKWPPTEVLLNFSLEAVRRIAGHVGSATPNEATMARLDEALGSSGWRDMVRDGVTVGAVEKITSEFCSRLGAETKMNILAVPVRRKPHHEPIYYMVFGTRSVHGVWAFSDAAARAQSDWWNSFDDDDGLFPVARASGSDLESVEQRALPAIAENMARLLQRKGAFVLGDYPFEVFEGWLGQVRETVARGAVKLLHAQGRTSSNGVGKKINQLEVKLPG